METIIEIDGKRYKVINNTLCPGLEFVLDTISGSVEMKSITTHDMELELIQGPNLKIEIDLAKLFPYLREDMDQGAKNDLFQVAGEFINDSKGLILDRWSKMRAKRLYSEEV